MSIKWTCPNGCAAVLGPTRPRADSTVRFCLTCSATAGKLVRRTAPKLEKQRAHREIKRKEKATRLRAIKRVSEDAYYEVDGVNLRDAVKQAWQLPVAREWRERNNRPSSPPRITVRRTKQTLWRRLGFAVPWEHRISVTVFPGCTATHVIDVLLHEVVHILLGKTKDGWHGPAFEATLKTLEREWEATDASD